MIIELFLLLWFVILSKYMNFISMRIIMNIKKSKAKLRLYGLQYIHNFRVFNTVVSFN